MDEPRTSKSKLWEFMQTSAGVAVTGASIAAVAAIVAALIARGGGSVPPPTSTPGTSSTVTPTSTTIARPSVVKLFPAADTTANEGAPDRNLAMEAQLFSNGSPAAVFYLRFDLPAPPPGRQLTSAVLTIWTTQQTFAGSKDTYPVWFADNTWDEAGLTWIKRPAVSADSLGEILAQDPDRSYDIRIELEKMKGLLGSSSSFAVSNNNRNVTDDLWIQSNKFEVQDRRPVLTLTFR